MPRVQSIGIAEKHSIGHLASAARQSASYPELPFKGMSDQRDPYLIGVAVSILQFFNHAEYIRVKYLNRKTKRLSVKFAASGMKCFVRGYGHGNAVMNLISRVAQQPEFWHAAL